MIKRLCLHTSISVRSAVILLRKFSPSQPSLGRVPAKIVPQKPWGKGQVKRAISGGGGLIFKGSGFYATDYRSEQYKAAAKKDLPATTPSVAESKPGTETKTAVKPESKPKTSQNHRRLCAVRQV